MAVVKLTVTALEGRSVSFATDNPLPLSKNQHYWQQLPGGSNRPLALIDRLKGFSRSESRSVTFSLKNDHEGLSQKHRQESSP